MTKLFKSIFSFMIATMLVFTGCTPKATQADEFKEGVHYTIIKPAIPTQAPTGKVEVTEMFWYGCPHCYHLEPTINAYLKTKPTNVDFQRVPATLSPRWRYHATLFYVGKMLDPTGSKDLHTKIFNAMQQQQRRIENDDSLRRFFGELGYPADQVNRVLNSMEMKAAMAHADEVARLSKADSVPVIIVNGKYLTSPSMAGDRLVDVINNLVKRETK